MPCIRPCFISICAFIIPTVFLNLIIFRCVLASLKEGLFIRRFVGLLVGWSVMYLFLFQKWGIKLKKGQKTHLLVDQTCLSYYSSLSVVPGYFIELKLFLWRLPNWGGKDQEQGRSSPWAGQEQAGSRLGAGQEQCKGRSKSKTGVLAFHIPNFKQIVLKI